MWSLEQQKHRLATLFARAFAAPTADQAVGLARTGLRMAPGTGGSQLGGLPRLDDTTPWPTRGDEPLDPLAVIDLIDLAETSRYDLPELPSDVRFLNVFFVVDAPVLRRTADEPTSTWRVVPAGSDAAERAAPEGARVGPTRPVSLRPVLTLPTWEDEIVAHTLGVAEGPYSPSPLLESYRDVSKAWRDRVDDVLGGVDHRIGGWPNPLQAPVFDRVARDSARYPQFSTHGSAWRLLLQLDTDDDLGWRWGDTGRLYFAIGEARLRAGEFAATWLEMQCT